jgi:hypothetical protein
MCDCSQEANLQDGNCPNTFMESPFDVEQPAEEIRYDPTDYEEYRLGVNAQLIEGLKTIKNIADTALILAESNQKNLIPTQLELLYLEAQSLVDDYCIEG